MDMEVLGWPTEGLRDEAAEDGKVGVRMGCCWRIRRKPDRPSPWSCSANKGDLFRGLKTSEEASQYSYPNI